MKKSIMFFLILLSVKPTFSQSQSNYEPLQLLSYYQLKTTDTLTFDLSGIVESMGSLYVIADKPWNSFIYKIELCDDCWKIIDQQKLEVTDILDLEAIDQCNGTFYLANEKTGTVYWVKEDSIASININFSSIGLEPQTWGNAGWEGLAIDCAASRMYLIKERQPRKIFTIEMSTWKIIDQFDISHSESNDFSDAKYQNGFLYLLERNGNYVTKIDPISHEVINKYHYRQVTSHPNGSLFGTGKYGMAEALLLTETEIWVGLDNNGKFVTDHAKTTYNMTGKAPVILKFKRPTDF